MERNRIKLSIKKDDCWGPLGCVVLCVVPNVHCVFGGWEQLRKPRYLPGLQWGECGDVLFWGMRSPILWGSAKEELWFFLFALVQRTWSKLRFSGYSLAWSDICKLWDLSNDLFSHFQLLPDPQGRQETRLWTGILDEVCVKVRKDERDSSRLDW